METEMLKIFLYLLVLVLFLSIGNAADSLLITFNNNQTQKIPINNIRNIHFENITGIDDKSEQVSSLSIQGNYPNPFQDFTDFNLDIYSEADITITILDCLGNQVKF